MGRNLRVASPDVKPTRRSLEGAGFFGRLVEAVRALLQPWRFG
jgi:hypothetical protein